MKTLSGKELAKLLERDGWTLATIRDSHHVYIKAGSKVRISIPVHGSKPLREGLLRHLLKMAEIGDDQL